MQDGPTAVRVPLPNINEFLLEVDDGGDGISYDQCDWANAAVVFTDGTRKFIDELSLYTDETSRRLDVPFSFKYDGKFV